MLIVLVKIKLEPKIVVLSQLKPIPLILGKVRTQHILATLINRIMIYFFQNGEPFSNDEIDILKIKF